MATRKRPDTRIQRSGSGHSYFLDGAKVPGVTTILGNGIPKPALVNWSGNTVAEFVVERLDVDAETDIISADRLVADALEWNRTRERPAKVGTDRLPRLGLAKILSAVRYRDSDAAARKGTEVHKLAEELARGHEIEVPEALTGHVDSYLRFLEEWEPTDALVEVVIVNRRWRYMGKTDMICHSAPIGDWLRAQGSELEGPARCLLDVKTSRSGIFPETALQVHAYANGETVVDDEGNEEPLGDFDFLGAIWVRADGYDLIPVAISDDTFRTFLYAKQVGEWLDRDGGSGSAIGEAMIR